MRRWIGSRPSVQEKKVRGKSDARSETNNPPQEQMPTQRSTEVVALALLDPQVSEAEEAEYQG